MESEGLRENKDVLVAIDQNEDDLWHIGIKRRSGRYPWGSGRDPLQRSRDFKSYLEEMRSQGLTDAQIAEGIGMHLQKTSKRAGDSRFATTDLRAAIATSTEEIYAANQSRAANLKVKGNKTSAIANIMGVNESTVRGWLKAYDTVNENSLRATAQTLKDRIGEIGKNEVLSVGKGDNLHLGISETRLRTALAVLRDEGYQVYNIKTQQLGTGELTTNRVLTHPDKSYAEAAVDVRAGRVRVNTAQSDDGGMTYTRPDKAEPVSVGLGRINVRYGEQGGSKMDGVIELRRGVEDLNLGNAKYAQVRIAVDGTHYLKGMAVYADDIPKGYDVRFNTNKTKVEVGGDPLKTMKPLKDDQANRFGATTYPRTYTDAKGKTKTSALNIVNEEGDWDKWSKTISSQMLSKQSLSLAATQLGQAKTKREEDLLEIMRFTNPVVKQKLLTDFADSADAASIHLKGAAFDRQSTRVILPLNSMRPHEIYAPGFNNGEKVVLVRHPHGGPFEIPELTVNNHGLIAKRIIGGAIDAVGIHHTVAEKLSGADFDGDTVLVIPNDSRKVKTRPTLEGLKGFDPKAMYPEVPGMVHMSKARTQTEMGNISNLITDMTLHNAPDDHLARAVRHSMVVIDAEKHKLNFKLSENNNGIGELKTLYQGGARKGAATIISRAGSSKYIPHRKQTGIDPKTGKIIYQDTGHTRTKVVVDKHTGEKTTVVEPRQTKVKKLEIASDARSLLSSGGGTPMERIYADHSNSMKKLADDARKAYVATKAPPQSKAAKAVYHKEVADLDHSLKLALSNAPLERRAQIIGNAWARARIEDDPSLDRDQVKRIKNQSLEDARRFTGANKTKISITDRQWEAIQAGAVSPTKLREILRHADMDRVKELAIPKARTILTSGQLSKIASMRASGRSPSEIAVALGVPRSTVVDHLRVN